MAANKPRTRLPQLMEQIPDDIARRLEAPDPVLSACLSAAGGALVVLDASGNVLWANSGARQKLPSIPPAGTPCPLDQINFPALADLFHQATRNKDSVLSTCLCLPGASDQVKCRVKAMVLPDGEVAGAAVVMRDMRGEGELDRMKSDFLSAVSHELRTPLTSILGYSNLLYEAGDSIGEEDRKTFLRTIETQGRVLLELINDLLEISKLDSGAVQLATEVCEPRDLILSVAGEYEPRASARSIELTADCPGSSCLAECDPTRVRQALAYLIDNAIKFTDPGGKVCIRAIECVGEVVIQVTDTGIGISVEDQTRLFEKFFQVDAGAARRANGTGLGLAIVKRIVDVHGGRVFVDSAPGSGSTFGFSLPRAA